MITTDEFNHIALSFPNTIAAPHFERTAYKVVNKRIFATIHAETRTANLKLSLEDQSVYCLINKEVIFAVNNKWGLQGWTTFNLDAVELQLMTEALSCAYDHALSPASKN